MHSLPLVSIMTPSTFPCIHCRPLVSIMTPSTFPHAFTLACVRRYTSERPSTVTIPSRFTKPSLVNLMFNFSLCCQTRIASVFSRLRVSPCFLNTSFHSSRDSCYSCLLSDTMAGSSAYVIFLILWPDRLRTSSF